MPLLSSYARTQKMQRLMRVVPAESRILEIGCGDRWAGRWLKAHGWPNYTGLDLHPPADIVGDIRDWRGLGIAPESFDVILAFEVIEHVPCFQEMYDILIPGGLALLTSPAPNADWACRILEWMRLSQRRTSPHDHLIRFQDIPRFEPIEIARVGLLAQWGVFRKPMKTGGPA
jgi:SAM-dependent methyltransferase